MNLIRLLAVGRTLDLACDEPNHYRMAEPGSLPRFATGRRQRSDGELTRTPPRMAAGPDNTENLTKKSMTESAIGNLEPQAVPAQRFPGGRWSSLLSFKTPKPIPAQAIVQGELALDAVKPVRNDLTDSDVVVVAGPAAGSSPAEPAASPEEPVWNRLKTQLFGAGKP
ncbi:MAG TPA: hypothetical protein VNH84_15810 [Candidatus Saccharimonadales bacterium]|jgi:hypothetical protein|nr:hypothetical protein [Candidatus Saccharimonadales bacterium]